MSEFQNAMMLKNIDSMNSLEGFDVVIVCCSSGKLADFWQHRLDQCKGSILSPKSIVVAVEEDWPGGAGNALGTLYAFRKAQKLYLQKAQTDLFSDLCVSKISIGLYHTAGKGTRLAPLPGSENNNKPGVKLPSNIVVNGVSSPVTILEAVVKQTGCYAKSRLGRLSVFWGDQIFIPTVPVEYKVSYHADILCSLGPMPTEDEWRAKGLEKYGLIAQTTHSSAQVEKVDHATAVQLLAHIGEIQMVGASLGSFSVSYQLLRALLAEFALELESKNGKLDSDPHLWMPMTLDKVAYLQIMRQKGVQEEESGRHFDRISAMMLKFNADSANACLGTFGPVDVGQGLCWWDYGQLKLYYQNALLMIGNSQEAEMMRLFFGVNSRVSNSAIVNTAVDANSIVSSCDIGHASSAATGFVRNSALSNVRCKYIEAENCIIINVTAERIVAKPGSIIYNVIDNHKSLEIVGKQGESTVPVGIAVEEKDVIVGVFNVFGKQTIMKSNLETDGGEAWKTKLTGNQHTFEEVYEGNTSSCPLTLKGVISDSHEIAWKTMTL